MAVKQETITVNGSMSDISISGTSTKSGSMNWSLPNLPDNAVILSTLLTAACSLSMSLGSATYTVNGTSYSSSSSISLDLGNTLVSSVAVTAKGKNFYSFGTLSASDIVYSITYEYEEAAKSPIITIGTPDKSKISDESGHDECICAFTSDQNLSEWEARATLLGAERGRGIGLLVESGNELSAGQEAFISVLDDELTNGDGEYVISVYGKSTEGLWSE